MTSMALLLHMCHVCVYCENIFIAKYNHGRNNVLTGIRIGASSPLRICIHFLTTLIYTNESFALRCPPSSFHATVKGDRDRNYTHALLLHCCAIGDSKLHRVTIVTFVWRLLGCIQTGEKICKTFYWDLGMPSNFAYACNSMRQEVYWKMQKLTEDLDWRRQQGP